MNITIESNSATVIKRIEKQLPNILPVRYQKVENLNSAHNFRITKNYRTNEFSASKENIPIIENAKFLTVLELLISNIRLTVAEFSKQVIFLHAGVVGLKNRAIVMPGRSFAGKTTLVAEFVKNGCDYFSDEYAIIDETGLVHPFPKKLSMRGIIDDFTQLDLDVEKFGGKSASQPAPIGYLLVTEYNKSRKTKARLEEISLGAGIMASIANSISIRQNPKYVLEILSNALSRATVLKSERGEAADLVEICLDYFNKD